MGPARPHDARAAARSVPHLREQNARLGAELHERLARARALESAAVVDIPPSPEPCAVERNFTLNVRTLT